MDSCLPEHHPAVGNPAWANNWTVGRGTVHGELLDLGTRDVWLVQQPITEARYEALAVPDGFIKSGLGESVADLAYFARSPGAAADGPLEEMEVDGLTFVRVARPGLPEEGFRGVAVLPVHKHHRVVYRAGRSLEVMDCGDGADYVPLMDKVSMPGRPLPADPAARIRRLPEGWSVRTIRLARDLVVDLPCPTRITVFPKTGESFQGPVRLGL